jgi:ATP-dependent DNA helicase RecG
MELNSKVTELPKVGPYFAQKLEKLEIKTIKNLLYHVPSRYMDYSKVTTISNLQPGETATIHAKVISLKNVYSKRGIKMQIGSLEDTSGKIMVIWFNQPFLIKTLYPGRLVSLSGKVGFFARRLCLTSPDYEFIPAEEAQGIHTGRLVPIYPETSGLSSKWLRTKMKYAFESVQVKEFLPETILQKNQLVGFREAIKLVHFPESLSQAKKGRERLAFNELLNLELQSQMRKLSWKKNKVTHKLHVEKKLMKEFTNNLPFTLTESQKISIDEITTDLKNNIPMNRLLEGDVGSGKTVVAAAGMFAAFAEGFQSVIMAPTQILATQHYQTLRKIFKKFNARISLVTAGIKKVEIGKSDIFVGTHSLIHDKVNFDNVAFVVIDEQHMFGVEQRKHLIKKTGTPHVLTMTATPIPRTVALTSYGDMDLSVLTDMPKGRKKVITWVVPEQKRDGAYDWIRSRVKELNSQAFIVCPLIEDSESETLADVKSVTSEFNNLKSIFTNLRLGLLHGRLKAQEKENILKSFRKGSIDILVTTPVVEVGIDIPNASIIVVEAAERFGLAQLHQLRGRVGRGEERSYCLLFTNFRSGEAYKRLKAMEKTYSGFELAELDLELRGPGEIFGTAQSGFPELKVASWNNYELIKAAKDAAEEISANPKRYPWLKERITEDVKQ